MTVIGSAAALAAATSNPASAIDISLKSPFCGTVPGPGLHLALTVAPSNTGFGATATATLCNATAVVTAIEMQFAGVGVNAGPLGGGPISGAPFRIEYANQASTSGHAAAASNLDQTVVVNVSAQSVTVGGQFTANCQAVVELLAGTPHIVKGC